MAANGGDGNSPHSDGLMVALGRGAIGALYGDLGSWDIACAGHVRETAGDV